MKELRRILTYLINKRVLLLWFIIFGCISVHVHWIFEAAGDGKFFLLHEDEVIYYCSAKVFSETNSVQAEGCIDENVSRVGRMNWYGPGYSVVYGSLFKIFGSGHAVFPWFHFALAMSVLAIVFLLPIGIEFRLLVGIMLLLSQQLCVYIYTFFPETLVLFMATILTLLLTLQFSAKDERLKRIYFFAFIGSVLLFALCRITFIFWLAGLIALAENKKAQVKAAIIFLAGVVLSLIYMKLFVAPAYAGEMHKIDLLYKGDILPFVKQTVSALFRNALAIFKESIGVKVLLGLLLASLVSYYFSRNKLVLAAALISITLIGVMLAYYNIAGFYFIKQTAMLVPLLLVGLIASSSLPVNCSLLIVLAFLFPNVIAKTNEAINTGRSGHEHYEQNLSFEKALLEIPSHIQDQTTVVLWCYREFDYGYETEALLPFSTKAKNPILYTTNIVDPSADAQAKFQTHNRLRIDYILSRQAVPWANLQEVHTTEYYHLYKVINKN